MTRKMIGTALASAKKLYVGNEPGDVAGCAQLCLLDKLTGIQPPAAKRALLRGDAWPRAQRGAEPRAGEGGAGWKFLSSACWGQSSPPETGQREKSKALSALSSEVTATDTARRGTGERGALPAAQAELLPQMQRKKRLQQVTRERFPSSIVLFVVFTYLSASARTQQCFFAPSSERYLK